MIRVTSVLLPRIEDFQERVRQIWASRQLTNHGQLVLDLERELADRLGARNVVLVSNGTIALQVSLRAIAQSGNVVTTPLSYVATTSAIVWEGLEPRFSDIDSQSLCIDPVTIERVIDSQTRAILATHLYGNACDIESLSELARDHGIRLIFDAAHAFGARLHGRALASFGDISILSFHATKIFHSGEGGAVVTDDDELADCVRSLRNFGHDGEEAFSGIGINGKMSELHAAMGLCVLPLVDGEIRRRKSLSEAYDESLRGLPLEWPVWREGLSRNYAYYPVLLPSEADLLAVRSSLLDQGVHPRRYFYPPLHRLPYVDSPAMPIAEEVSRRVLCLPMGQDVAPSTASDIASSICRSLENGTR